MLHEIALENLSKIKTGLESLSAWEQEFVLGLIENERITAERNRLSPKEFSHLQRIANKIRRSQLSERRKHHGKRTRA